MVIVVVRVVVTVVDIGRRWPVSGSFLKPSIMLVDCAKKLVLVRDHLDRLCNTPIGLVVPG